MEFKDILKKRYAVKKFTGEKISSEKIEELKEIIQLSPSSFGLQPWEIKIISDEETKEKLFPHSYNQEQITTCSHLLVFCADSDVLEKIEKYEKMLQESGMDEENIKNYIGMMKGFEENMDQQAKINWASKQTFIAMTNALNGATSLGFDSCPMEGFSPEEYKKILNLPENLHPCVIVSLGTAEDSPHPKIRYSKEEMFS